jgi:hypothetical protein
LAYPSIYPRTFLTSYPSLRSTLHLYIMSFYHRVLPSYRTFLHSNFTSSLSHLYLTSLTPSLSLSPHFTSLHPPSFIPNPLQPSFLNPLLPSIPSPILPSYHPTTLTISTHYTTALHHTPLSVSLGIFGKIKSTVDGEEQVRLSPEFFMLPDSYAVIVILDNILISKVKGYGITHQF